MKYGVGVGLFGLLGLVLGVVLCSAEASAQCTRIIQNGTVQSNMPVTWVAPCVIAQPGPSGGSSGNPPMLKDLGVQGNIGILDASIIGPYHTGLLGWSQSVPGEFDITLSGFGGAVPATAAIILNNVKYPIPGSTSANVSGPTSPFPTLGNVAVWNGGTALKDGGLPPGDVRSPATANSGNAVTWDIKPAVRDAGAPPRLQVGTIGLLKSLPLANLSAGTLVGVQGYSVVGDMPPSTYQLVTAACSFASGNGDGGYQIPSNTSNNCWQLAPQNIYDVRQWGVQPPVSLYVSTSGNDYSGANLCIASAVPCATITQAISAIAQICVAHQNATINVAAGSYTYANGVSISGLMPCQNGLTGGGAGGNTIIIAGAGSGSTTVSTGTIFVFHLDEAASVQFSGMTMSIPSGDDGLFLSGSGTFDSVSGTDVVFSGASGAVSAIHAEGNTRFALGGSGGITLAGSFITPLSATFQANLSFDPGSRITCSGLTITGSFVGLNQLSTAGFPNTPFSGCSGNTATPFKIADNSYLQWGATTIPFTGTGILIGASRTDTNWFPCVGGSVGCAIATTPTGFGTGATYAITTRSTAFGGQVQATAGTTPSSSGTIWISIPVVLQTQAGAMPLCMANIANSSGGTAWPNGSTAWVATDSGTGGTSFRIDWQSNSVNLTNTGVYSLNWICNE